MRYRHVVLNLFSEKSVGRVTIQNIDTQYDDVSFTIAEKDLIARKNSGSNGSNRYCTIAMRIIALLITAYGIKSSFEMNMGSKLIMYSSFDITNADESAAYLWIMRAYIGTYYMLTLLKILIRRNLRK